MSGRAWRTEFQKASTVWPESVRPEASVMVPEIMTGQRRPRSSKSLLDGEDRGLGVEGVEDRLDQQQVGAAVDQAVGGCSVGRDQLVEGDVARARVVDVRRDRGGAVGGAERAGDEARRPGCGARDRRRARGRARRRRG
jgi:hypothetical protein